MSKESYVKSMPEPPFSLMKMCEDAQLGSWTGGFVDEWNWYNHELEKLSIGQLKLLKKGIEEGWAEVTGEPVKVENYGCATCAHCFVDYTIDTQEFVECRCESSLMYMTNLSDVFNGTHPNWGCTEYEERETKL